MLRINRVALQLSILIFVLAQIANAQNCPAAYFFNGQRCSPCQTNCQCSQQNTCSSCLSGYTYDALFQNCLQCPQAVDSVNIGCSQCCYQVQGPAFVCSSCQSGIYVYQIGGQCLNIVGCVSLTQQGACTKCASGYYLSQGVCQACDPSCATCYHSSLCLTCNPAYYNGTDVGYSLCQSCSLGCISCTTGVTCVTCGQYYRISAGSCISCTSNCQTCTSLVCTQCNTALSGLISGVCYLCTDISVQGSLGCTTCTSNGVRILCSVCSNGYYLNSVTQKCVVCSTAHSTLCNATNVIQCQNDNNAIINTRYYLVNNLCVLNTNNCRDMLDSTGKCSSCYFTSTVGYYSLNSGVCTLCNVAGCSSYSTSCQCLSCQSGYQYINNQCIACQNLHCSQCQASISSCQYCLAAYGRLSSACVLCQPANCNNCDGDNTVCSVCNTGYYLSGGNCYSCQSNCLTCLSKSVCSTCVVGTFLQSNGRCKTLPLYCLAIDNTTLGSNVGSCKRCLYGYILIQGNCYPCSSSLFNVKNIVIQLGLCLNYHCPNYYAQLTYEYKLFVSIFVLGIVLMLL